MPRSPRRGEIYRLKSDAVGKSRPVLVVSRNELHGGLYLLAIPFYSAQLEAKVGRPSTVFFRAGDFGLEKDCVAKADEVTQWKISDLKIADGPVGTVDDAKMADIDNALAWCLGLSSSKRTSK